MNLSHKLTISSILILLVAFVSIPAMAQVTVEAYKTDEVGTADDPAKRMYKFEYSGTSNPDDLVLADFTTDDNVIGEDDADSDRDVLMENYTISDVEFTATIEEDDNIVTLTLATKENSDTAPAALTNLMLKGYSNDLTGVSTDANSKTQLTLVDGYIGGLTYVVYVRGTDASTTETPSPHLPVGIASPSANSQVMRTIFAGADSNSNVVMPNLESFFFEGGGTIDLNVEGTAKNSKHLIINEVMWAVDDRLVGLVGYKNQQWIEVYNRKTAPAPAPKFKFTNNSTGLNPPPAVADGTSDRLSNIPSYTSAWNLVGENGTSTVNDATPPVIVGANPMFKSMYRSKQGGNGWASGSWAVSGRPYLAGFYGTPGKTNVRGVIPSTRANPPAANPAMDKVIINEVYDAPDGDANNMNDWLELRVIRDTNLENWVLSYVNGVTAGKNGVEDEHEICRLPKVAMKAGDLLLIVNTDPTEEGMNLAAGNDVTIAAAGNRTHGRTDAKYVVVESFNIPSAMGADALLILRGAKGWERHASRDRLEDVVGTGTFPKQTIADATPQREPNTGNPGHIWQTKIFPLNGQNPADFAGGNPNSLLENKWTFTPGVAWARSGTNKGWLRDGGRHHMNKGGIGYDRAWSDNANAAGTPGYPNDAYKETGTAATDNVYISEIMYAHDGNIRSAPQWIELHNPSRTASVNLDNFRLTITNHDQTMDADGMMVDWTGYKTGTFNLSGAIPPGQTYLIVSATARRDEIHIPDHQILNIFRTADARKAVGMTIRSDNIFNLYGFSVTLNAKTKGNDDAYGQAGDSFSNLADPTDDRRGSRERFDPVRWTIPNGTNEEGQRVSLARRRNTAQGLLDGRERASWILSNNDRRTDRIEIIYYGEDDDISTPGQTVGSPLPVELSFFRPTSENGKVTIQWTTESELDNAGFNILRSETRNGEFKQVNEHMIQGKGTTAERTTYKWVDTTAKTGAVYYYQIEDVSFAGEHNKLSTTKLKGLISAKGKLTTQWGNLKNLR